MKQKKGKFRRAIIAAVSSVCVFTSLTAIDALAATATKTGITSEGYVVSAKASFSGKNITGIGSVSSGPPCSIAVSALGYSTRNNVTFVSCSVSDKLSYGQSLSKSASADYTIVKSVCKATFNSNTTITVTAN